MNLNPITFLLLSQSIIFLLGWPLEWTEIIIIFVPIFLPMLPHFSIDPMIFGILVAINLQTAFLSPPMAMAAYYLKGVSPPSVLLTQIFSGCMPFVYIVLVTMVVIYVFPQIVAVAAECPVRQLMRWTRRGSNWLSATDAARAIRDGLDQLGAVDRSLPRADPRQPSRRCRPGQFLDEEHALAQARARDHDRREGKPIGPLHGVPVGIKDIIDTADMPTEDGTVLHAGRTPARDATVVAMLRAAGAVIMGKTVTTDRDVFARARRAIRTTRSTRPAARRAARRRRSRRAWCRSRWARQTNGSVIRPAAFCGVVGFKPTHGLIPRHGILKLSRALDTSACSRARSTTSRCIAEQLAGYDERDPDTRPRARIPFVQMATAEPPLPPRSRSSRRPCGSAPTRRPGSVRRARRRAWRSQCEERTLPESLRQAWDWHRTIMEAEMAANLDLEWEQGRDRLSESLREPARARARVRALDYQKALAHVPALNQGFAELFSSYDAVLTPAAPGVAPKLAIDRGPGVLHAVDVVRHARAQLAADERRERIAARRTAGRPAQRRRAAAAHGALAGCAGRKRLNSNRSTPENADQDIRRHRDRGADARVSSAPWCSS